MPEPDMGHPDTLKGFLEYVKSNFPSSKLALALYGHGDGWISCLPDHDNAKRQKTSLDTIKLAQAINQSCGLDLLIFTAPCHMASSEVMYAVKDCTNYYMASEEINGMVCWLDAWKELHAALAKEPSLSPEKAVHAAMRTMGKSDSLP